MTMGKYVVSLLVLLQAGIALGIPTEGPVLERLVYEASYKGPLTADEKISIASLAMTTRGVVLASFKDPLLETSLRVSSEVFPFVEENFPFRLRIRSLYQVDSFTLLAVENYRLTDELKHELTWVDRDSGRVGRYRAEGDGPGLPVALGDWINTGKLFRYYKPARHKILDGLTDRLSMLQSLRLKQLKPGAGYRFSVTDGKHLLDYRAEVVGLEQIRSGGKQQQAWKLLLSADSTRKGVTSPDHAPIHLWLSKDHAVRPLRFVHHHPLGTFTVDLQHVGK